MPRIEHKLVGEYHVFTSPDVPGFYVAHRDEDTARASIQPTLDGLARMAERRRIKDQVFRPAAE